MALKIKKKERESSQSLVYRFSKRIKESGILLQARRLRFHQRSKSEQAKKRTALRREQLKKEYQRLKKLGEIK